MKILGIVETAYRAVLEEQDDTALWFNQIVKNSGAEVNLLLKGNAVNYLVRDQDASGLRIGEEGLAHPPAPDRDLERLISSGAVVYAIDEDIRERGLPESELIAGVRVVPRGYLPELLDHHAQIWHW
jgi:intracellular sulfur oxidation DsrE/DsrF family protein